MEVPYSNVSIYKEVVYENYSEMVAILEESRTPREDGGYIIKFDPSQSSFKKSMVVVVFTGMWLEAIFHQFMVTNHSKNQFNNHNKKSYKEKLELMGIKDLNILDKTQNFQKTRNELIHEKSFMDKGEIKLSQKEAEVAYEIINYVSKQLSIKG